MEIKSILIDAKLLGSWKWSSGSVKGFSCLFFLMKVTNMIVRKSSSVKTTLCCWFGVFSLIGVGNGGISSKSEFTYIKKRMESSSFNVSTKENGMLGFSSK